MIMGNLLKKCFKLFIVCMMCISVVACGARNKDYSEISQILKDNDYEFEVQIDCSYAYVKKGDYVYGMLEGSKDLFYIDNTDGSGQGVLDVENDKFYKSIDLKKELTSEEDKKTVEKYKKSYEENKKKLDLTTTDFKTYITKKWDEKKKEYSKLSKTERLNKQFDVNYFTKMPDSLIDVIYDFYSEDKFNYVIYSDFCNDFINEGPYKDALAQENKKIQKSYSSKYDVSINSMIYSGGNLGITYDIKNEGSLTDVQYMMVYSLDDHKLETIACRADTDVEKTDFYLWSIVLLRSLLEKTYTSTEWLSLLADSISSPQQVDNYAFKVSMDDDDYMLIVLPQ